MRINPSGVVREPAYREGYRPERSKVFPGRWCVVHVKPNGNTTEANVDLDDLTEQDAERRIRELYDASEPKPKPKGSRAKPGGNKRRKASQLKLLGKGKK